MAEATTTEIAPDVFRISVHPPGSPVSFGCFLIRDEAPAMVETGLRGLYPQVHDAVRRLIDPARLRYLVIPHFEMDECGSLNEFLALAPHAEPVCSPVGALVTLPDFAARPPRALGAGEALPLGRKTLRAVLTPWVHFWDSMVVYDETDQVLFTSDLFMQGGEREPLTSADLSADVVAFCRLTGLLPSQRHLEAALARIEPLAVQTLACHHGAVLAGDPRRYYRALRESAVGDVLDADFYEGRLPGPAKR
jgi:flavorubredoxin